MIIEDLLIQSGVDYRELHGRPDEVTLCCPFCVDAGLSEDTKFRFGLNIENGKAHCFHCGFASRSAVYTARMLCKVWDIDFSWRLRLSASGSQEMVIQKPVEPVRILPVGLPADYESFGDLSDEIERRAFDYLRTRRITRQDIEQYQIGYAGAGEFSWRILFPVIGEDGEVYGCAGRDFSGIGTVKYLNTPGLKLLFNGQRKAKTAVVVEGVMDVLAVSRVIKTHFPHMVGVGALGSAVTPQQIAQLAKYETVIHFPDNDVPGVRGAIKRADATVEAGIETTIIMPDSMSGADPGSMTDEMIADCIRSAKPWTKSQKLRLRLRALK